MDLGANQWTTLRAVTLPLIAPGIAAAALLAFAISLDDFVITNFTAGQTVTFPLFVWGARPGGDPAADQRDRHGDLPDRGQRHAREHPLPERPRAERSGTRMTIDLQQAARDHLWLHFTRMGAYADAEVPIIVRGDGCYLEDSNGKRYLDALAGLFAVQIGYSHGDEVGQAAHEQMRELPFYTNWSFAHPRAIELAHEVAALAPGDLNRAFFVSGGSEAVEAAWKLARQFHRPAASGAGR